MVLPGPVSGFCVERANIAQKCRRRKLLCLPVQAGFLTQRPKGRTNSRGQLRLFRPRLVGFLHGCLRRLCFLYRSGRPIAPGKPQAARSGCLHPQMQSVCAALRLLKKMGTLFMLHGSIAQHLQKYTKFFVIFCRFRKKPIWESNAPARSASAFSAPGTCNHGL